MATPYQVRELKRSLNSLNDRYYLGQPHLPVNGTYDGRTNTQSRWSQWILGVGDASVGHLPIDRVIRWLAHPSVFFASHPAALRVHRDRLAQIRGGGPGWHLDQSGVQFIARFEGFRPRWYDDGTGTMTIGFGHTHEGGVPRPPLTRQQGFDLLGRDLTLYENAVKRHVTRQMTTGQRTGLTSFVFNLGEGVLSDRYDLGGHANRGDWRYVAREMPAYSDPGSSVHDGLLRRRNAEAKLVLS